VLNFLLLMLFPLIIALVTLLVFKGKVLFWEFAAQVGVVALFVAVALGIAYESRTSDTEVWNGQVTAKKRNEVSCRHSYECNCYYTEDCSGSGSSRSCTSTKHCSTCYEHSYDVDWDVYASTGESTGIDTIDRQGLDMPPRWGKAYLGEPWESEHSFTNYILANPDSVLLGTKGDMQRFGKLIPKYPDNIYDYYYNNPVINMGVPNVQLDTWNWLIRDINKVLGPKKQVHIIVILVPTNDRSYMLALKDAWVGGKKNDVDVVIGSSDGNGDKIDFADVMSWSTNKTLAVDLRDRIQADGSLLQKDAIVRDIGESVDKNFVRMHMKDMKWLMRSFQPSQTAMIVIFILATLISIGLSIWAVFADLGEDDLGEDSYGHRRFAARIKYSRYGGY
jgi:hypothetical protein